MGLHFPFLLRLPGILADLALVLVLLRMSRAQSGLRIPTWALAFFAASPVSVMVSGFHGNTDPVMVLFLACASFMCVTNRPVLCGLFLALSCQIKIVPLLFLPAFAFYWLSRQRIRPFCFSFIPIMAVLWSEPLLNFPALFAKNVLSYGSYWGIWGATYLLRLTGWQDFSRISFFDLTSAQAIVIAILKLLIIGAAIGIAWRRRQLRGEAFMHSMAYIWIAFFVFAPGVCAQYLIWLAPFILILSPVFYGCLLAASSIFLFAFYNSTAGGLPWSVAISTNKISELWLPWSLLPWAVLIAGSILLWKRTAQGIPALRLLSFETLPAESA